ncbi:MAG TPA: DUF4159 domain-containing protein [Bryobacteraceae bacterium]|nr:DUF4159 domain-containing protein [Bryobacteraceae bacterium]
MKPAARSRRFILLAAGFVTVALGAAFAWQMPWRQYPGQDNIELPPDYQEKTEWQFARLMYPQFNGGIGGGFGGRFGRFGRRQSWSTDYDSADRHVARALRRLTRVHVRSVEQPVSLDDGNDVFYYPWLYAVEVGHWELSDAQAKKMREYIDRGGFFMCDDFHGSREWAVFMASMQRVFPDRPIVDIPNDDPIFHVLYDLSGRYQVPGEQYLRSGVTYEQDGYNAEWKGIYDDKGRLVVAICHNMDLGDAWEWADYPAYDEKFSALAFRIVSNYVVYSMTH